MTSLKAIEIGKTFPGVVALDSVSFEVQRGTIHALVGANGAGKSTLIKLLSGVYADHTGLINVEGAPVRFSGPADALRLGIEVVHQEVDAALIPTLSLAENLFIETFAESTAAPWLNLQRLNAQAKKIVARVGLRADVRRNVDELSLHQKQLLLIARAVSRQVRFLILDEPTASLSLPEIETLFQVLRDLRANGVGVIYISHRLAEVQAVADEITVLRNGQVAAHFAGQADLSAVVAAMLGSPVEETSLPLEPLTPGDVVLEVSDLTWRDRVNHVSFNARRGEVVGLVGLVGAGKTELLRLLFGADKPDGGTLRLGGKSVRFGQPQDAVREGVYLVPEERRRQGLWLDRPLRENITIPFLPAVSALGWILQKSKELTRTTQAAELVGLSPAWPELPVQFLSGGNQQKAVVGRWLGTQPCVLLFDEATQGIDVSARRDLHVLVRRLAKESAVIYASADLDEVVSLADRLLVMHAGKIVADVPAGTLTRQEILELATGANTIAEKSSMTTTQTAPVELDRFRPKGWTALREFLLQYGMILAVALLLVFFSWASPYFLSITNFLDILRAVSILGIVAIGVTLSVVVNGFDASVGATTGLAVMLSTALMVIWRLQWFAAIPIALLAGLLVGLLNAWLVVKIRIPDLLATLGVLYLVSGLQLAITRGDAVYRGMANPWSTDNALTRGQIAPEFLWLGQGRLFASGDFSGIPVPVILLALIALAFHVFLNHTRFGRLLYATGGNVEAARLAGVNVNFYRALAYVLSGLLATTGGLILAARIGTGAVHAGDPYLLDGVSATYFGFAVLAARRPNVIGTILGAIFVGVMLNGLTMLNMPWYLQDVVKGLVLMASLGLSFYLSPRRA